MNRTDRRAQLARLDARLTTLRVTRPVIHALLVAAGVVIVLAAAALVRWVLFGWH